MLNRSATAAVRNASKCEHCGGDFPAKRVGVTKFCSIACKTAGAKAKPRNCTVCDALFSPIRWQKTKNRFISDKANTRLYCSLSCRAVAYRVGREKQCIACSVWFTPVRLEKASGRYIAYEAPETCSIGCRLQAFPVSEARRKAQSERFSREGHPNWQGGSHRRGFRGHGWSALAEKVRKRAGRCCERCGKTEADNERRLDVNHKTPFHQSRSKEKANRLSNLEALCRSCHQKTDWIWRRDNAVQYSLSF